MLRFTVKLQLNDGMVKCYYPARKTKIWSNLVRENWKSCYIKVLYGKNLYNHGTFETTKDAQQFVGECTEPALLEYAWS